MKGEIYKSELQTGTRGDLILMLVIAVALIGCSKKEPQPQSAGKSEQPAPARTEPAPQSPATAQPPPPPDQSITPVETTKIEAAPEAEPGIAELNSALQAWVFKHNNPPKDFGELVKAGLLKRVPTPPAGRRYVLNPLTMSVSLQ